MILQAATVAVVPLLMVAEAMEVVSVAAMETLLGLAVNLPGGRPIDSNEPVLLCDP